MRASSALKVEWGITAASWSAWRALRMRVRKSAMGSVWLMELPAALGEAGDVALVRVRPKADPAEAKLAQVGARPAALAAAVVFACLELGRARLAHAL